MRERIDFQTGRMNGSSGPDQVMEEFDLLGPVQAGIRARSIVETCDALALPSVFIDRTGRILHVGRWAAPFLGSSVKIVADHLVGQSERINREIQNLLNAVLAATTSEEASPVVVIETEGGDGALSITAHFCDDTSPYQLLKAILVFSRGHLDPRQGQTPFRSRESV